MVHVDSWNANGSIYHVCLNPSGQPTLSKSKVKRILGGYLRRVCNHHNKALCSGYDFRVVLALDLSNSAPSPPRGGKRVPAGLPDLEQGFDFQATAEEYAV